MFRRTKKTRHIIFERICGKGDWYRNDEFMNRKKKKNLISKVKSELKGQIRSEDSHIFQNESTAAMLSKHDSNQPP